MHYVDRSCSMLPNHNLSFGCGSRQPGGDELGLFSIKYKAWSQVCCSVPHLEAPESAHSVRTSNDEAPRRCVYQIFQVSIWRPERWI